MFMMQCLSCKKENTPFIDKATDKVYCGECEDEIPNISHFTKITLKSLQQFRQKKLIPYAVKCQNCNKEDVPTLIRDTLICSKCKKPLDKLSEPFKIMLKNKLKSKNNP